MLSRIGVVLKRILFICVVIAIAGCASRGFAPTSPQDPYEYFNRKVFAFNMAVDRAFFRPVVKVYDSVLPWPVKTGVRNFFGNIGDVTSVANSILQLRFARAIANAARVVINTTAGVGGLFDVSTRLGIAKDREDFGMTLARWGCKETPYIVIPFLGPYTLRDAVGAPVDYYLLSVWPYIKPDALYYSLRATYYVQARANLLPGDEVIDQAFDPYIFVRDAYLQRRAYLVEKSKTSDVVNVINNRDASLDIHSQIPAHSVISD